MKRIFARIIGLIWDLFQYLIIAVLGLIILFGVFAALSIVSTWFMYFTGTKINPYIYDIKVLEKKVDSLQIIIENME